MEIKPEKQKHIFAFERYYALGDKRRLADLATEIKTSLTTIEDWSRKYDWQERIQLRDQEIARRLEQKTINSIVDDKAKFLNIVKASVAQYVARLNTARLFYTKDGRPIAEVYDIKGNKLKIADVKINSPRDLKDLIQTYLLLTGEGPQEDITINIIDSARPLEPIPGIEITDNQEQDASKGNEDFPVFADDTTED